MVHGSARYGTPRRPVEQALADGRPALLEIDLQGARQVRASMPGSLFVFLKPPSWEELVRRLEGRGHRDASRSASGGWRPRARSWRPSGSSTSRSSTPKFTSQPRSW